MRKKQKGSEGQSLVELALTLPVLLILLLGLVEVGFALRAYLVLTNVSRETARLASRGIYQPDQIFSYATWFFGEQLPARYAGAPNPNTEVIVTYFFIPYDDKPDKAAGCPSCNPPTYPACDTCATYMITTTGTLTETSRIDVETQLQKLRDENFISNDELGKKHQDSAPVDHNVAIIEIYYYHKQVLMDAPVISWVFPDTMPMYARTMMRIGQESLR